MEEMIKCVKCGSDFDIEYHYELDCGDVCLVVDSSEFCPWCGKEYELHYECSVKAKPVIHKRLKKNNAPTTERFEEILDEMSK